MFDSFGFLLLGTILLFFGAEWVVKGGVHIAEEFHISPIVIGLTVVAFGTSLPELVVSLKAALSNSETIAIGNVVGSNIANVGLVLGISSIIFPITIKYTEIKRDLIFYLIVCILFIGVISNGIISSAEGALLTTGIIGYTLYCIKRPPVFVEEREEHFKTMTSAILALIGGIGLLWAGAEVFVFGAVKIARLLGISEIVIGMTIVALGTSLPEFATSFLAALRKQSSISIGNIIGSNIFNILSVLGITALIKPLMVPTEILKLEIPFMLVFGIVLFPLAWMKQPVTRWLAALLFAGYIGFILMLFVR
ncbi:MAG: calcium/sodium antiporter [Candidatus Marinimicrobia bacterium]|nr:calcium/sodium antiporter [Candidatus Neomarinimicrobiota bacterium]